MDFGKQKKSVDFIQLIETGYSIPWTKANIQKIVKETGLPPGGKVSCSVKALNGINISVETIQDLMNGTTYEELIHFERTPTDEER